MRGGGGGEFAKETEREGEIATRIVCAILCLRAERSHWINKCKCAAAGKRIARQPPCHPGGSPVRRPATRLYLNFPFNPPASSSSSSSSRMPSESPPISRLGEPRESISVWPPIRTSRPPPPPPPAITILQPSFQLLALVCGFVFLPPSWSSPAAPTASPTRDTKGGGSFSRFDYDDDVDAVCCWGSSGRFGNKRSTQQLLTSCCYLKTLCVACNFFKPPAAPTKKQTTRRFGFFSTSLWQPFSHPRPSTAGGKLIFPKLTWRARCKSTGPNKST